MIALFDNYIPVLGIAEVTTVQEKQEEAAFLDAILATPVMAKTLEFLKGKGNIADIRSMHNWKEILTWTMAVEILN